MLLVLRTLPELELLGLHMHHSDTLRRRRLGHTLESTAVLARSYIQPWAPGHKLDEGCRDISDAQLGHKLVEELAHKLHEEPGYIFLLVLDCTLVLLLGEEHFYIPLSEPGHRLLLEYYDIPDALLGYILVLEPDCIPREQLGCTLAW